MGPDGKMEGQAKVDREELHVAQKSALECGLPCGKMGWRVCREVSVEKAIRMNGCESTIMISRKRTLP